MRIAMVAELAEGVVSAFGSAERRRVVVLAGLNVGAAVLAIGALHLGGALVNAGRQPAVEAPSAQMPIAVSPAPHVAAAVVTAAPTVDTLFAAPVVEPASFVGGQGGASPALSQPPVTRSTPAVSASRIPPLAKVVSAKSKAVEASLTEVAGPLMLTDAMLDAKAGTVVSAATGLGVSTSAGVASAIGGVATTSTSSVAAAVSGATSAVSGATSAVGSAVGGIASGVAGGIASAAR